MIIIDNIIAKRKTILLFTINNNKKNKAKKYVAKDILSPDAKHTTPIIAK